MARSAAASKILDGLYDNPLVERLWRAALGEGTPEEIAACRQAAKQFVALLDQFDRFLARYEPADRPRMMQRLLDEWLEEVAAMHPTLH